jgi:hypothetical protein
VDARRVQRTSRGRTAILSGAGVCAVLLVGASLLARRAAAPTAPCPPAGAHITVRAAEHRLYLCQAGRTEASFPVAIGRGGLDKRSEGDGRTPSGRYPLGTPRTSERFHRFLPVDYPTAAQRAEGRTGSAIGVHGPDARFRWLGPATTWVDWTAGCIAVGTRGEIDAVADWVTRSGARTITIE